MPGLRWTSEEKEVLRQKIVEEHLAPAQVDLEGRTVNAIRSQVVRMGLVEARASRAKWTSRQERLLEKLKEEGLTPSQIYRYDLLGDPRRTLWSITKKWGRMKLSDRKRSRQMKRKKRWKPGEREEFDRFLRDNSKKMTPEQIGKDWKIARSTVARRQVELGLKVSRDAVMQMDYSLEKQRRARKRIRRGNIRNWERRRTEREERLVELANELRTRSTPPEEQVCSDCNRSFPKRREFFHTTEKKISIGRSRYFKHRCVLC